MTEKPITGGDVEALRNTLRDVLKAIVSDRHAVQDTIWVNGTPIGDFIMCALDEDIDLDELQNAPYRCKRTGELNLASTGRIRGEWRPISEAPENTTILATDGKRVDYGTWRKGELWDIMGNDWNGYTHFMPLPAAPGGE